MARMARVFKQAFKSFCAIAVLGVLGALLMGCPEDSDRDDFVPAIVDGVAPTSGSNLIRWRPNLPIGIPVRVDGKVSTFLSALLPLNSGETITLQIFDPGNPLVVTDRRPLLEQQGDEVLFGLTREDGDIVYNWAATTGSSIRVISNTAQLAQDPHRVLFPNVTDFFFGATPTNNRMNLLGTQTVIGQPSGNPWPGLGDNILRLEHVIGNTYNVSVRMDGLPLGPNVFAKATWNGTNNNFGALIGTTQIPNGDGFFSAANQNLPDSVYEVAFVNVDSSNNELQRLSVEGSEYAATTANGRVFRFRVTGGIMHHPDVVLTSPAAASGTSTSTGTRISPNTRQVTLGERFTVPVLADYTTPGGVKQTHVVNKLISSGWTSSDATRATVDQSGLVQVSANNPGPVTISTVFAGRTVSVVLDVVSKTVTSVSISAPTTQVTVGQTIQFTPLVTFTDGSSSNSTTAVTWSVNGVGIINSSGLFTATTAGTANVTATATGGGVTRTSTAITITVTAGTQSLTLSVTPGTTAQINSTLQFTVIASFVGGQSSNVTTSSTFTLSANVGTINSNGLFTATTAGTANVTALFAGLTSNAISVTVTAPPTPLVTFTLSPAPTTPVTTSFTLQLTGTFSDGQARTITFTSDNTGLATVDSNGRVTIASTLDNGGIVTVTGRTADNLVATVEFIVYGIHGAIRGRLVARKADADTSLNSGSGAVVMIGNVFSNFAPGADRATRVTNAQGAGGQLVPYYELDPADNTAVAAGTFVRWNLVRRGTTPNVFHPSGAITGCTHVVTNTFGTSWEETAR